MGIPIELEKDIDKWGQKVSETGLLQSGCMSEQLKDCDEFFEQIIGQFSSVLCAASERLRDNKDLVIKAVKQNGMDLEYASYRLQNDKEVVLEAVKQNSRCIMFAGESIKNIVGNHDPQYILETIIAKEKLEQKIAPEVNLKSLEELREEKCMTRKNKI